MPYRPKAPGQATKCGVCRRPFTKDERERRATWCNRCADPEGYLTRLAQSHQEARQRVRDAYPEVPVEQTELFTP